MISTHGSSQSASMEMIPVDPGQRYVIMCRVFGISLGRKERMLIVQQLVATVLNPWQWFCSTRTLSNCLETTLTIVALELWPWQWSAGSTAGDGRDKNTSNQLRGTDRGRSVIVGYDWTSNFVTTATDAACSLHQCLPLAALACILRPTNILVWATLAGLAWLRTSWPQRKILIFEAIVCG